MVDRRDEPERDRRISIPNIPIRAAPWYLSVFTAISAYLTVTNTLFVVATEKTTGWSAIQYIVTGELLKAGGVALITSPIIVEVGRMVLAEIWTERRLHRLQQRWEDWLRRREEAEAKGEPFDEPPPKLENRGLFR